MKCHKDWEKRVHPLGRFQIDTPPPRNARFVKHRPGSSGQGPIKRRSMRAAPLLQEDGIADESPMITACYETHLAMKKMLAAFAELRGDDPEDAIA
jgi:hypothetical protein